MANEGEEEDMANLDEEIVIPNLDDLVEEAERIGRTIPDNVAPFIRDLYAYLTLAEDHEVLRNLMSWVPGNRFCFKVHNPDFLTTQAFHEFIPQRFDKACPHYKLLTTGLSRHVRRHYRLEFERDRPDKLVNVKYVRPGQILPPTLPLIDFNGLN